MYARCLSSDDRNVPFGDDGGKLGCPKRFNLRQAVTRLQRVISE
jgi:hypothetical protein